MQSNSHRLVYRPWKVDSALLFVMMGIILIMGVSLWTKINETSLQSSLLGIIVGTAITVYGFIFCFKNSEFIIFDANKKQINKKYKFFPERNICTFNKIYSISQVSEGRVFHYALIMKSQYDGNNIQISDDFLINKSEAKRKEFEEIILPTILNMLDLRMG
ncbi:hypothetical protein RJ490_005434 [Pluralibacter gergoviae]|mgnify:CR=1 FL=1|uniref:hypothetical protein n=1 Tax=Pluralibacter gergoviae TaxID=61647 RepID=UPI0006523A4C|nr:hypothetical protein [Pluralibacter gergoviae]EKV0933169.1 hypothetical protein [Pluralibacter gergoviae]EKW9969565.1 hypothetical protein [Pluralibacter gergoviae]ELD4274465.1 hypothetical protein [Pluralibacter gergoviae]ELD4280082.1 hypothetical protein [Pluralibacter gergoviae]ELD4303868.1 hypothetical protein [Pluralibacter gergoviae]